MRAKRLLTTPLRALWQLQGLTKRGCVKCLRFLVLNFAKIGICCCLTIVGLFLLLTFAALFYSVYVSMRYGRASDGPDPLDALAELDDYDQLDSSGQSAGDWNAFKQRQRLIRMQQELSAFGGRAVGAGDGWKRRIGLTKARQAKAIKRRQRVAKSDDFVDEEPFVGDAEPDGLGNKPAEASIPTQAPIKAMNVEPKHLSRKARDTHAQLKKLEKESKKRCAKSARGVPMNIFATVAYRLAEQSACATEVDILILVHSHWSHSDRRELIRSTYGSLNNVRDSIIQLVFVIGLPDDSGGRTSIEQESRNYHDIVLGNFPDTPSRRLLKDFLSLHWALNYCPTAKFVAKLDDDTFVDTLHLATFLDRAPIIPSEFIYCSIVRDRKPPLRFMRGRMLRGIKQGANLPPHCAMAKFLATSSSLARILGCSQALRPVFLADSETFFTGAVVSKAGLNLVNTWKGHGFGELNRKTVMPLGVSDYIFLTVRADSQGQPLAIRDPSIQEFLWRSTWKYLVAQYEF